MDRPEEHQLVAYLYGELSEEEARGVDRALEADPQLRRKMEDLRATQCIFGTLEDPVPPPFVGTRLKAEARQAAAEVRGGGTRWAAIRRVVLSPATGLAAAGALASVVALAVLPQSFSPRQEATPAHTTEVVPASPVKRAEREGPEVAAPVLAEAKSEAQSLGGTSVATPRSSASETRARSRRRSAKKKAPAGRAFPKPARARSAFDLDDPGSPEGSSQDRVAGKRAADSDAARPSPNPSAEQPAFGAGPLDRPTPVSPKEDASPRASAPQSAEEAPAESTRRWLGAVDSELARADRRAARAALARAVERTRGSPDQGWVWLRWAEIEFEDDHLEMSETYATRALRVKGFQGRDRTRALLRRIGARLRARQKQTDHVIE